MNSTTKKLITIFLFTALTKKSTQLNMYFNYKEEKVFIIKNAKVTKPFIISPDGRDSLEPNFIDTQDLKEKTKIYVESSVTYSANLTFLNDDPNIQDVSYTSKFPFGNSSFEIDFTCDENFGKSFKEIKMLLNLNPFKLGLTGGVDYNMRFYKICNINEVNAFDTGYIVLGIMMLIFVYLQSRNISGERLNRHYMDNLNPFFLAIYFGSGAIAVFLGFCYTSIIEKVLVFCFIITGFCSINIAFSKLLKYMYRGNNFGRERTLGIFSMNDVLCWIVSAALIIGWVYFDDWLSHNLIAMCILSVLLDIFNFPRFKYLILLSLLLVFYDLFWIFSTLPDYGYIPMTMMENFRRIPCYLKIPRLNEFPGPDFILFGFTDILILGITLKFFRAFDEQRANFNLKSSYGQICFLNYLAAFFFYGLTLKIGLSAWPFSCIFIFLSLVLLMTYAGCNGDCTNLMKFPDGFEPPIPLDEPSWDGGSDGELDSSVIIGELLNNDSEGLLDGLGGEVSR